MTTPGPDLSRYRAFASRLRAAVTEQEHPDRAAYAALVVDGERQPFTEEAARRWAQTGGPWRAHHLAVAHHSHAYDLEASGDPAAFEQWRLALRYWAEVHGDDQFWDMLREHLEEVTAAGLPDGLLDAARGRLPDDLLAPHVALASRFRLTDPARARGHVGVILACALPAAARSRARDQLSAEAARGVGRALGEGRYPETIAALESWLAIDASNTRLARLLLLTARQWFERESRTENWPLRIADTLDRVHRAVGTVRAAPGGVPAEVTWELARLEYWRGFHAFMTGDREAQARPDAAPPAPLYLRALEGFRAALRLDPALADSGEYHRVGEWLGIAATVMIMTRLDDAGMRGAFSYSRPTLRGAELSVLTEIGPPAFATLTNDEQSLLLFWTVNAADAPPAELRTARILLDQMLARPTSVDPQTLMLYFRLDAVLRSRGF